MENRDYFSINETFSCVTLLVLVLLAYDINNKYIELIMFWLVLIISYGNIRKVYSVKYEGVTMLIRRGFYVIPLFFPLFTNFEIRVAADNLIVWSVIGGVIGILFILPDYTQWCICLNNEYISLKKKQKKINYISQWIMLSLGAVGEEIFFRAYILETVCPASYTKGIAISTWLFFMHHFGVKWSAQFSKKDKIYEITFAVASSVMYLLSYSILPSIVMHLTFNGMHIIRLIKEFWLFYGNRKFVNKKSSVFEENFKNPI